MDFSIKIHGTLESPYQISQHSTVFRAIRVKSFQITQSSMEYHGNMVASFQRSHGPMAFHGILHVISWNYEVAKVLYHWEFQATVCQIYFANLHSNLTTFISRQFNGTYRLCSYYPYRVDIVHIVFDKFCHCLVLHIRTREKSQDIYRGYFLMSSPERKCVRFYIEIAITMSLVIQMTTIWHWCNYWLAVELIIQLNRYQSLPE